MKFEEVIGQHDAKERLRTLVAENRLPHALLFCGPEGNGKMALAMAFASYLLCANRHDGDSELMMGGRVMLRDDPFLRELEL